MTREPTPEARSAWPPDVLEILSGGGEMGALVRAFDWEQTPVGPATGWPQSLRTAVSILLESKFPMLLCWGADYIQFYNDPFRPILGASKHPALGRSTRETFDEAWHIIGPLFEHVMRGEAVGFEDMLVPLDRYGFLEECYFLYSYSPIRDETGGIGGILVTCTETSGRVLAERRLRTLRELASQAALAQEEVTAWSSAAQVIAANPADIPFACLYTLDGDGCTARLSCQSSAPFAPDAIMAGDPQAGWPLFGPGTSVEPRVLPDLRQRFGDHVGPVWPEVLEAAMVLPVTRPGLPQPYGFLVTGTSPRLALDARYRDFLVLVADQIATAIANARAYAEERRRTEALRELDRQKTAFFSNVSHEFRTPLTLLLAPVEDALSRPSKTLAEAEVALVYRNAVRLLRLVNALLDFSRIEAGRAEAVFEETDLSGLTREIASGFESLMEQAGLTFAIDCSPRSSRVHVDRSMWEKIVLNLLSNAFKFTLSGGVELRLRERDDCVELSVRDTGAGIPASHQPAVFDRFHRVEGTPARTFEGSGIGLALVRELVRMHGGDISVESVEGEGSTFTVTLPTGRLASSQPGRARASSAGASAVMPYVEEASRWIGGTGLAGQHDVARPGPAGASAGRVLVVDDNADMREYLQRTLAEFWTVATVVNGREALEHILRSPPDLVISDVMMPELDGLELLGRIRSDASIRALPVIMLSARAGEESRIEGLGAGADDYVSKPFSARELVARVRTQLELSRLRRETALQNVRLRTLLEVAPAAIAVVGGPGHVFEVANDLYCRLVGRHDLVGRRGRDALPELVGQGIWDLFDRVRETGEPYVAHECRLHFDRAGHDTPGDGFFDLVLQPLRDRSEAVESILVHVEEVTEQVSARRALDNARRAAESANRAKDEFLAMLGHELRNPLAPILTALQLMSLRGDAGAEKERAVIERQVRHVVRLVDDLLDVSRIARGKIELKCEPVELAPIVAKAIEIAGPIMEQKHQVLDVDVPASGLVVDADPTRLQQVVLNLLNNAAKYTETRGHVRISAGRRGDTIELRVRDSGIGIEPSILPHVFDLFVQDRQALDRAQGGLGLGLAIVRNLVALHGGDVRVSSGGRGQGSEFMVSLPASVEQPPRVEAVMDPAVRPPAPPAAARVLVVDDNLDAASFLAEALTLAGFVTRTAHDGPSALQVVDDFNPDVALLDLGLPVMDGYELAEHLQRRDPRPVLVAITGYGSERDQRRSQTSGFDTHLIKPVDINELIARLRHIATRRS
jgi:signal transduction histidine kinase